MAKRQKFKGFTNEQRMKLLKSMGYDGPMQSDDIEKFIASNPKYTKKMAEYVTKAVKMVNGGVVKAALGVDVQKKKDYTKAVQIEDVQNQYDLSRPAIFDNDTEEIRPGMTQMPTGPGMDGDGEPLLPTGTNNSEIRHFGPESNASVGLGGQLDRSVGQPNVSSQLEEPVLSESKVFLDNAQTSYSDSLKAQQDARDALAADPTNADLKTALDASNSAVGAAQESVAQAQKQYQSTDIDSTSEMLGEINKDPTSKVTKQDVATTSDAQADAGTVADDAGEAGEAEQAVATDAVSEPDAIAPEGDPASTYDATTTEEAVKEVTDNTNAAEGTVSDDAQVKAVTKDPKEMSQLELEAAQIDKAQTVAETEDRKVEDGEMIEGSTVDMDRVKKDINFEAATGSPSTDATVQGQLTGLMEDFEGKDPPPWAAGAMRAAAGAMAARGLSSSSMAGQAMIQAAMESAIPIAQQDATTFAKFEAQNLSNKQQSAMFAAEKRAEFLGLEFNQDFQTRVANSAKISDIANVNFTADQQVALENARMAQSVDIANLGAKNAKVLSDAAAMSQMDLTNLNNRQKAAVQNAKSFLEMDMKNLDNEQATNIFKAQQLVSSLFNDQSAENAAAQFNATSENQTDQFFSKLAAQTDQFNIAQKNGMEQFNAGETNAVSKFNTQQLNAREEFNATNSLVVEQANAKWFQTIATTDNAALNQANRDEAAAANGLTTAAFNAMLQESRDIMSYAWQGANNDADRITSLAIAKISSEDAKTAAAASKSAGFWGAIGNIGASLFRGYMLKGVS